MKIIITLLLSLTLVLPAFSEEAAPAAETNLIPNGDLTADMAGFRIYYKGANGQPLINKAKVIKIESEVLHIDPPAAGPLGGGMLFFIDIPQEDIETGKTYVFSFEAKSADGDEKFMMTLPGEVKKGKFGPDKENMGFTGKIGADWSSVEKTFTVAEQYKNKKEEYGITFLLNKVEGEIMLKNFQLIAK